MHLAVFISSILFFLIGRSECDVSMAQVKAIWSRYSQISNGDSTYYGEYPVGTGACELDPISPVNNQDGWITVAAGEDDFQKSLGCGMCAEIEGDGTSSLGSDPGNDKPITGPYKATVVDLCGGCNQGGFDLFITGNGKWKTSYKAIECATVSGQEGKIKFRFDGSNNWYLKIQVRNSKVVTVGLELLKDNKWHCMRRGNNNHFTISPGETTFPIKVRVTSIFNEQLEATIESLENDVDIPSKIQYTGIIADSKPEDIKCYGQGGVTQESQTGPGAASTTPSPESTSASTPGQGLLSLTTPAPNQGPGPESTSTSKPGKGTPPPVTTAEPNQGSGPESTSTSKPGKGTPPPVTTAEPNQGPGPGPVSTSTSKPGQGGAGQPSPTSPVTAQKPTGQTSEQKDFCKERANGQYPDKTDCSGFIVCSNGITYKKKCPAGLKYNEDLMVCDWPRNVNCKELTI